jgi:hypothetical protein
MFSFLAKNPIGMLKQAATQRRIFKNRLIVYPKLRICFVAKSAISKKRTIAFGKSPKHREMIAQRTVGMTMNIDASRILDRTGSLTVLKKDR